MIILRVTFESNVSRAGGTAGAQIVMVVHACVEWRETSFSVVPSCDEKNTSKGYSH